MDLIVACLRVRHDAGSLEGVRARLLQGVDWSRMLRTASEHRVCSLLLPCLTQVSSAPSDVIHSLRGLQRATAVQNLALIDEIRKLAGDFEQHGIRAIFFKGPVLASDAYGSLALRPSGDIDVLVAPRDVARGEEVLLQNAFVPFTKIRQLGRVRKGLHLRLSQQLPYRRSGRVDVDLHAGVVAAGYRFTLGFEELYERTRMVDVAGTSVRSFAPEDMLLILCYQGVTDRWKVLKSLCDVAELVRACPDLAWEALMERAQRIRGRRILHHGLYLAHALFGVALPKEVIRAAEWDDNVRRATETVIRNLHDDQQSILRFRDRIRYYLSVQESLRTKSRYLHYSLARRILAPGRLG